MHVVTRTMRASRYQPPRLASGEDRRPVGDGNDSMRRPWDGGAVRGKPSSGGIEGNGWLLSPPPGGGRRAAFSGTAGASSSTSAMAGRADLDLDLAWARPRRMFPSKKARPRTAAGEDQLADPDGALGPVGTCHTAPSLLYVRTSPSSRLGSRFGQSRGGGEGRGAGTRIAV